MRSGFYRFFGIYPALSPFAKFFLTGNNGFIYDASVMASLFQDAAGTIPVTASGDPVGLQLDLSGNRNHRYQAVSANRPIYVVEGGISRIRYNGVNQFLRTDAVNLTFSDKVTFGVSVSRVSSAGTAMLMEMSANVTNNPGSFYLTLPELAQPAVGRRGVRPSGRVNLNAPFPIFGSLSAIVDLAGTTTDTGVPAFRYNGATLSYDNIVNPEAGGGNFGSYPFFFGRRNGASIPFLGDEFSCVVVSRSLSATELDQLDYFSMIRAGVAS